MTGSLLEAHCRPSPYKTHSHESHHLHSSGKPRGVFMYFLLWTLAALGSSLAEMDINRVDRMRLCLFKRGRFLQELTPCNCATGEETLLDLGRNHFPRFLANFQCETNPCYSPPFYCTGLPYKVKVLKRREISDETDVALPEPLRAGWKFVNVHVNVGCVCNGQNIVKRGVDDDNDDEDVEKRQLQIVR